MRSGWTGARRLDALKLVAPDADVRTMHRAPGAVSELEMASDDAAPPARRDDGGNSLIEVLVAIVLTGTLVLAVVNAITVAVGTSGSTFASAETSTVLLNASDRINRAPQLCDYEPYVDAAALAEEWDPDLITVEVERLVANTGAASDWEPQPCPADVNPFDVQRLTITATNPGGSVTKSITVVKSDVS